MPRARTTIGVPASARAFTLVEMLIVVAAISVASLVIVSGMGATERSKLNSAAALLASDLEQARILSITSPADLTTLRTAANGTGYWLARVSAPDTPITRSDGTAYRVIFGAAPADGLAGVGVALTSGGSSGAAGGAVTFDAFGRLATAGNATLTLTNAAGSVVLTVYNGTGDVVIP